MKEGGHDDLSGITTSTAGIQLKDTAVGVGSAPSDESESEFRLRSYQNEMLEASLKQNTIIAMDTGSGKTHIALARTSATLERCDPNKLVWFLAPTVTLCRQQYQVFKSHQPANQTRMLSGEDNIDCWKSQGVWDDALKNIRIVISTPAVLLDALTHGFVNLVRIALLILDEAHHCIHNHPANQIMRLFYNPLFVGGSPVPEILGLSASPIISTKAITLEGIEENLNSRVITPKAHRLELLRHTHRPFLQKVTYDRTLDVSFTKSIYLQRLHNVRSSLSIQSDPYILHLLERLDKGPGILESLYKAIEGRKTYCYDQMRLLFNKAAHVYHELGGTAADWYMEQCILKYRSTTQKLPPAFGTLQYKEKNYLLGILNKVLPERYSTPEPRSIEHISPKFKELVKILEQEASSTFTGIIFVEQRATVAAFERLLAMHETTKKAFKVGTHVGSSVHQRKKSNIDDFVDLKGQIETLEAFRAGSKNLIVATSVLEEGIDIPNCHIVICYEPPKNIKSFIQRRGRARKEESKYVIMMGNDDPKGYPQEWEKNEEEMKLLYMDDLRQTKVAESRETINEDSDFFFRIPRTNALLSLDNAIAHLNHFCSTTARGRYVNSLPQYSFKEDVRGSVKAEVILPLTIDPLLRKAESNRTWSTAKKARKDAAFQACKTLYQEGLLNDNLLPLSIRTEQNSDIKDRMSMYDVPAATPPYNPWQEMGKTPPSLDWSSTKVTFKSGREETEFALLLPQRLSYIPEQHLYWSRTKEYRVKFEEKGIYRFTPDTMNAAQTVTHTFLSSVYGTRMAIGQLDFLAMFVPYNVLDNGKIEEYASITYGYVPAVDCLKAWMQNTPEKDTEDRLSSLGFLRENNSRWTPMIINRIDSETQVVQAENIPRRRNFLWEFPPIDSDPHNALESYNPQNCTIDKLPASISRYACLFPSIIHQCEQYMRAEKLRQTVLDQVEFGDVQLFLTAITASVTGEKEDYQRLEFLGDTVLKLFTALSVMAQHPTWPEAFLTAEKDSRVSNETLVRACRHTGLDQFIRTERMKAKKWKPMYVRDIVENTQEPIIEQIKDSKILADVIEALIGAAVVEGGFQKAHTCILTLLPKHSTLSYAEACQQLYQAAPSNSTIHAAQIGGIERLTSHNFSKKLLALEALTHGSFNDPSDFQVFSYERLEFLGDAVLDFIIKQRLFSNSTRIPTHLMHTLTTASVNNGILSFLGQELSFLEERIEFSMDSMEVDDNTSLPHITTTAVLDPKQPPQQRRYIHRYLWHFLRHSRPGMAIGANDTVDRHVHHRDEILHALQHGPEYPWCQLAEANAEKCYSDIIESMIGALFLDGQGSLEPCETFIRKLGLFDLLDRLIRDGVECMHPKERLGIAANGARVKYDKIVPSEEGLYNIQLIVSEKNVGEPVEAMTRFAAETKAAYRGLQLLLSED